MLTLIKMKWILMLFLLLYTAGSYLHCAVLYGDVLVRLLVVGLDHYGLVGYFLYRAVNGGEDVCAETGGSGYQCALFYLVAGLYYCRARRANMLLEQKFDFPHDALPFPF